MLSPGGTLPGRFRKDLTFTCRRVTAQTIQPRVDPEYASLLPPLGEREFQALKDSIRRLGLLHPIIVNADGLVLDGHHRLVACRELGVEPRFVVLNLGDRLLEKRFVLESNLLRRHLNAFQRVEFSLPLFTIERELAQQRQVIAGRPRVGEGGTTPLASLDAKGKAAGIIGNLVGVSQATCERALALIERAPEVMKAEVRSGRKSVNKAYGELVLGEKRANPAPVPVPRFLSVDIRLGDFRAAQIPEDSIDLVLTDPPYGREHLGLWRDLGILGKRVLKPGGWLVSYITRIQLPVVLSYLSESLCYHWEMGTQLLGNHDRWKNFFIDWRPIIVYYRPPLVLPNRMTPDLLISPRREKSFHRWGQGVAPFIALTEAFSTPGSTVLEPFAGGGTTVQACIATGRNCIAYENDSEAYDLLKRRFCASSEQHA